jgi:hypothetical protein
MDFDFDVEFDVEFDGDFLSIVAKWLLSIKNCLLNELVDEVSTRKALVMKELNAMNVGIFQKYIILSDITNIMG